MGNFFAILNANYLLYLKRFCSTPEGVSAILLLFICACEMSSGWGHLITLMDPSVGNLNGILARVEGEFEQ